MSERTFFEQRGIREPFRVLSVPDKPASWQDPAFQAGWESKPAFFDTLQRFSLDTLSVYNEFVALTVLGTGNIEQQQRECAISEELIGTIHQTLTHIADRCGGLHALKEISFCSTQPINPENHEPANGLAPVSIQQENDTGEFFEVPSGTIILFPHATAHERAHSSYRDRFSTVSHIQGIVTHEWAHQFMAAEGMPFSLDWVQSVPGWTYQQDNGFVYTGSETPVTSYAATNPVDDFVESLTIYLWQPEYLEAQHPERFFFCQEFVTFLRQLEEASSE